MKFFGCVFRYVYSISNSNEETITIVITAIDIDAVSDIATANTTIRREINPTTTTPWTFPTSIVAVICCAVFIVVVICGAVVAIATILVFRIFID